MANTELEIKDDINYNFKSPLRVWTDNITIALGLFVVFVVLILSRFHVTQFAMLSIAMLEFGVFMGVRRMLRCDTEITLTATHLHIYQYNALINKEMSLLLALDFIRGFEIRPITRGFTGLVIYDRSNHYYKFSLIDNLDTLKLQQILEASITLLDKTFSTSFSSYSNAFIFGIQKIFLFLIVAATTIGCLYFSNVHLKAWPYYFNYVIGGVIAVTLWWWLVFIPVKRKQIRFGGTYWLVNAFLFLAPLFIIPIIESYQVYAAKPKSIKYPVDIIKGTPASMYIIQHTSVDPHQILYSNFIYHRPRLKRSGYLVNSYATPLESGSKVSLNRTYMFWLVKKYSINVQPTNDEEKAAAIFRNLENNSKNQLFQSLRISPTFYTLMLKYDADFDAIHAQIKRRSGNIILLSPHWESVESYQREYLYRIIYLFLLMVGMSIFWCATVANNR